MKNLSIILLMAWTLTAQAAVTGVEAQKLNNELTPLGAQKYGNGTDIPSWSGQMQGVPDAVAYRGEGQYTPSPYRNDHVSYVINSRNQIQHRRYLSDGLKAMLRAYPKTFTIAVYPSHRDGRYSDKFELKSLWNAKNALLLEGSAGIRNYTGGVPFPVPKNGREVMWNARLAHPNPTLNGQLDTVAVYSNGKRELVRERFVSEYPFANPDNKIGLTEKNLGIYAGLLHVTVEEPSKQRGNMTMVQEPILDTEQARQAWVYMLAYRRVRQFPTLGFDAPYGPGGIMTIDDLLGFNGSMERFTWKLLGKREQIIPYHANRFDRDNVGYGRLLPSHHANPDFMRYEKHRVWVVEANLKEGQRHSYQKRRFYIDEDSWQIVLTESFDRNGVLWKVGMINTVYNYEVKGYVSRVQMHHDLISGAYVATRLINETAPPVLNAKPKGYEYYKPANLRKLGNR